MNKSPCNGICKIHTNSQICIGCGRAIFEIKDWDKYTYDQIAYHTKLARNRLDRISPYTANMGQSDITPKGEICETKST